MLRIATYTALIAASCVILAGCRGAPEFVSGRCPSDYQTFLQQIEYPDAEIETDAQVSQEAFLPPPTVRNQENLEARDLTLQEAIQMAVANSEVIRRMGGRVVESPSTTSTIYDPAIQETDPRFGPEAALAAFDSEFYASLLSEREQRRFNNRYLGLGGFARTSQLGDFNMGLRKTTATGTSFEFENNTFYNRNNASSNIVPSVYDTNFSASLRHPLLRGGGIEFNRIAGPRATPGNYNGVLIARINNDIILADFEAAVRDLVRDVERTYWGLYFTYRDLDAKMRGRAAALETWQIVKDRFDAGHEVGRGAEAFSRDQFFLAQAAVENALSGTATRPGVYSVERELRLLLGIPATDGSLIRPSTPPLTADIQFDWEESLRYSLVRRVELRKQRWRVNQRKLEQIAARNFRLPQLDFVSRYNWRGFGDELTGPGDSAFADLFRGDLQGWVLGMELRTPVGNRVGHLAVRNAELRLRREQALLEEQERQMAMELRAAFTELDRAYAVSRSTFNRREAANVHQLAQEINQREGQARLDVVLESQRRAVEAESDFHRSIVDYNLAFSQVHLARGTLLDAFQVYLNEGPWSAESHAGAAREASRLHPRCIPIGRVVPGPVSVGAYPQRLEESCECWENELHPTESTPLPSPDRRELTPVVDESIPG